MGDRKAFEEGLKELINRTSTDSELNIADFILTPYIVACVQAFARATREMKQQPSPQSGMMLQVPLQVFTQLKPGDVWGCEITDNHEKWYVNKVSYPSPRPRESDLVHRVPPPQRKQEFAFVEATFDCRVGNLELRVWRKRDFSSEHEVTAVEHEGFYEHEDIKNLVSSRKPDDWLMASLALAVARLPGIAAVQVRLGASLVRNGDYSTGVAIYVDWP